MDHVTAFCRHGGQAVCWWLQCGDLLSPPWSFLEIWSCRVYTPYVPWRKMLQRVFFEVKWGKGQQVELLLQVVPKSWSLNQQQQINQRVIRNANPQASPLIHRTRNSGVGPSNLHSHPPSGCNPGPLLQSTQSIAQTSTLFLS